MQSEFYFTDLPWSGIEVIRLFILARFLCAYIITLRRKKKSIIKLVEVMHGGEIMYYTLSNGNEITMFPDQFLL